ncbi:MAG: hypothetical protein ACI914_001232 [Candidatus Marivariicella framensis]|jgi:hypothetical protein
MCLWFKRKATKVNYGLFITNKLITMRVKTDKAIVKVICESFIITFKNLLKYMIFDFSRF